MTILYSARHYVILSHNNVIYCYSYNKLIAIYDVINKILTIDQKQVSTATNKMHLKLFKEYINNHMLLKENEISIRTLLESLEV